MKNKILDILLVVVSVVLTIIVAYQITVYILPYDPMEQDRYERKMENREIWKERYNSQD